MLYRPSCAECSACLSARIRVADFEPSRSHRRTQRRNAGLVREATSPWATEDQFELFRRYLDSRHAEGGMADMDIFEFAAMIEETPIRSRVIEYSAPPRDGGRKRQLTAVCLTDVLDDGLSMVLLVLRTPRSSATASGRTSSSTTSGSHARPGCPMSTSATVVPGSAKMGYKARFPALEIYHGGQWQDIGNPDDYSSDLHPLSTDPIAEQVARIALPELRGGK